MLDIDMPATDRWSDNTAVVLGQNPGPFTGPGTNTYIVGTGAQRILLDTGQGVPAYIDLLAGALEERCDGAALERIVVTHAHPDHLGGIESVIERFGPLPVAKKPWPDEDRGLTLEVLDDGDVVATEGATLRAVWTPGHAQDHLCFYMEEGKTLFTGDVVLGAGTTVIPRNGDLGHYLDSLRRLLELDMEVIFPAHGPAIHEPHAKIQEYLDHRALRDEQISDGLAAGLELVADLVRRIYVDIPEFLYPAAGVSVEAHLRRMRELGTAEADGGRWRLL